MNYCPKFTVIIPVYNVAAYLAKCIDSVLKQEFKQYEVILIDDGSTDESGTICDKFAEQDKRIVVIHQKNKGLSAARNIGIENAKGEYILFLDSDDYWHDSSALNIIYSRLNVSNADILSFNYMKFCDDVFEKPYFKQDTNMPLDKLEKNSLEYQVDHDLWIACAWNKVIKRELFYQGKLYFNLGITSEDIDWCLRLALYAEKFDFIANVIVCYRQRKTSISNSITVQKMDMLIDNIVVCLSLLEKEQKIRKIDILKPYIGYQYGTAIYSMSFITNKKEYNRIMKRLNQNKDVLRWSKNRKVQMLQLVDYIGGNKLLVFLLRIKNRLNKLQ